VLLIVMFESRTWRVRPGEPFTFGRATECSAVLPAADPGRVTQRRELLLSRRLVVAA